MQPRIGITYSSEINVLPYADAVRASGGEPVVIAPGDPVGIEDLDGLLLGGGVDVNPELYGEQPRPETQTPNDERDQLERDLLASALQRDLPVLAICRGMQMLNVAAGGSLAQHIENHEIRPQNKALPAHTIQVESGSKLNQIHHSLTVQVNSRHHQAVARVGEGLQVTARAEDGTVEALESPAHRFVVGVQWHPEDMAAGDKAQKQLFDELVSAAKR